MRGPSVAIPPPPPGIETRPEKEPREDETIPAQRARVRARARDDEGPTIPEPVHAGVTADLSEVEEEYDHAEHEPPSKERRPPRQRAPRARSPRGGGFPVAMVLIIAAAVATFVLTIIFTRLGEIDYSDFVFMLVVFILASLLDLKLKGGGKITLGVAPLIAALIALPVNLPTLAYGKMTAAGAVQVIWMFLLGTIVVLMTRLATKITKDDILGLLTDFTGVGLAALVFYGLIKLLPKRPELLGHYTPAVLGAAAVSAGILYLFYLGRESYTLSSDGELSPGVYFQSVLRKSWLAYGILAFTGAAMGLIFVGIGVWSMIVVLPFLLIFMYAYNRVAATDQYLLETIRVLSAIPEETGMLPDGHADRVSELALGVARELGLSPEDAQQVEYAAYLHDIGAVTRQGIHGPDQRQLTEVEGVIAGGVDIVGKVPYLEVAAEILGGREGLRDRVTDVEKRRAVSVGAGILRAVDDFETLVQGNDIREPISENDALTEMNLERGVKYDSKVLRAIARVLTRMPREIVTSAEGSSESSPFWGDEEG